MTEKVRAIGLMSGTSLDGIDAALISSDGGVQLERSHFLSRPYDPEFRRSLRQLALAKGEHTEHEAIERELTLQHAAIVRDLLAEAGLKPEDIEVIGFHGHTLFHDPVQGQQGQGVTCQAGDGKLLAKETGIPVVYDFRANDIAQGGEGAPLVPVYHRALALAAGLQTPLALLNLGGVANITWIGSPDEEELVAFDCGPGNALIDDWMQKCTGTPLDEKGETAAKGTIDKAAISVFLTDDFFLRPPPKSLDRDHFKGLVDLLGHRRLSVEDGAATLTAATIAAVAAAVPQLPVAPEQWIVCGGGRHNGTLMSGLSSALGKAVRPADMFGWNGDATEAEAFAYLALRHLQQRPVTFPQTTGAPGPLTAGNLAKP